ncbi:hypothetical protein NSP70_24910, partial [Salmonella enterica]|nr:hypothetical protein [Salmonella enterica]
PEIIAEPDRSKPSIDPTAPANRRADGGKNRVPNLPQKQSRELISLCSSTCRRIAAGVASTSAAELKYTGRAWSQYSIPVRGGSDPHPVRL